MDKNNMFFMERIRENKHTLKEKKIIWHKVGYLFK